MTIAEVLVPAIVVEVVAVVVVVVLLVVVIHSPRSEFSESPSELTAIHILGTPDPQGDLGGHWPAPS